MERRFRPKPGRLADQVRDVIRVRQHGIRTEEACTQWIRRYLLFHNKQPPRDLGEAEIASFLMFLAVKKHAPASTRNQAPLVSFLLYVE